MADPWIRVHANLVVRPIVDRFCTTLRIKPAHAVGLLVCFWGQVSQHAQNGRVGHLSDIMLERWAGWEGRRGQFANALREHHLDEDGRCREWDDYAGTLETRREKDRTRKREFRERQRADAPRTSAGSPRDVPRTSAPTIRDETKRDESTNNKGVRDRTPTPEWVGLAQAQWATKLGQLKPARIKTVLGPLVAAHGWVATSKAIADYLTATPGSKARIEWFAERGTYWVKLAAMPLTDPQTCQPTERMRVVVDGKAA